MTAQFPGSDATPGPPAPSGTRLLSPTLARSVLHAVACRHGPLAVIVSGRGVPSPSPGRSDSFPSPASGDRCTHSSSCLLVKTLLLIKSRFRRVCTEGRERGVTGSRGVCPAVSGPPSGLVGQQTHSAPRGLSDIESPAPVPLLFLTRLLAGRHSADSWHRGLVSRTDTRTRRPRSAGSGVWPIFSPSASPLFKGLGVRGLSPVRGYTLQNRPPRGPTLRQRSLRRTRP